MEKRELTRVPFEMEATIKHKKHSFKGKVENLSLKGMFILSKEPINPGEEVDIVIHLAGKSSELEVKLNGKVVRITDDGIGLQFHQVDLDSFIHLRSIVTYNSGDEEKVMEEFFNYINHRRSTNNK